MHQYSITSYEKMFFTNFFSFQFFYSSLNRVIYFLKTGELTNNKKLLKSFIRNIKTVNDILNTNLINSNSELKKPKELSGNFFKNFFEFSSLLNSLDKENVNSLNLEKTIKKIDEVFDLFIGNININKKDLFNKELSTKPQSKHTKNQKQNIALIKTYSDWKETTYKLKNFIHHKNLIKEIDDCIKSCNKKILNNDNIDDLYNTIDVKKLHAERHTITLIANLAQWGVPKFIFDRWLQGQFGYHLILKLPDNRLIEWSLSPSESTPNVGAQIEKREVSRATLGRLWFHHCNLLPKYTSFGKKEIPLEGLRHYRPKKNDCHTYVHRILKESLLKETVLQRTKKNTLAHNIIKLF